MTQQKEKGQEDLVQRVNKEGLEFNFKKGHKRD